MDPIIQNPLNSQSLNPYSYIGNNPLSGTDPTGYMGTPACVAPHWVCQQMAMAESNGQGSAIFFSGIMAQLGLSQGGRPQSTRVSNFNGAQSLAQLKKNGELDKLLAADQRSSLRNAENQNSSDPIQSGPKQNTDSFKPVGEFARTEEERLKYIAKTFDIMGKKIPDGYLKYDPLGRSQRGYPAYTNWRGVIVFNPLAFDMNEAEFGTAAFHENSHHEDRMREIETIGIVRTFFHRYDEQWAHMSEVKAYNASIWRGNPFRTGLDSSDINDWLLPARQIYFDKLTRENAAQASKGNFSCLATSTCD